MMHQRVERILTEREAQTQCAMWQRLLRIEDWDIEVRIVRRPEFSVTSDSAGECNTWFVKKRALIHLLHPDDYASYVRNSRFVTPQDMEVTLVHELLHVVLTPITLNTVKADSPEATAEEQVIEALSRALVGLMRETQGKTPAEEPVPSAVMQAIRHLKPPAYLKTHGAQP